MRVRLTYPSGFGLEPIPENSAGEDAMSEVGIVSPAKIHRRTQVNI